VAARSLREHRSVVPHQRGLLADIPAPLTPTPAQTFAPGGRCDGYSTDRERVPRPSRWPRAVCGSVAASCRTSAGCSPTFHPRSRRRPHTHSRRAVDATGIRRIGNSCCDRAGGRAQSARASQRRAAPARAARRHSSPARADACTHIRAGRSMRRVFDGSGLPAVIPYTLPDPMSPHTNCVRAPWLHGPNGHARVPPHVKTGSRHNRDTG
jgi:hypothetical protein